MPEPKAEDEDEEEYRSDLCLGAHLCARVDGGSVLEGVTGLIFTQLQ